MTVISQERRLLSKYAFKSYNYTPQVIKIINFQESRSAAVLQFLEKVLKLKNKSFQSPIKRADLTPRKEKEREREHKKSSSLLLRPKRKEKLEALEKLFDIAGDDWDRQFKKKRKKEKVKKTTSFICPQANTF